jgi:hypothetical protein
MFAGTGFENYRAEIATTGPATTINAQRWASNTWELALPGQTYNAGAGTVTVSNVNNYAIWALADVDSSLPIELTKFAAVVQNGVVELSWTTQTEINNDYFTLERSADDLKFEEIGIIQGAGSSHLPVNYVFEDKNPLPGRAYYRLKQTDFDRTFTYSKVISTFLAAEESTFRAYPNPLISSTVYLSQKSNITVYNSLKQLILQLNNVTEFDASSFYPGIYIVINQQGKATRFVKP